ncbi:MAG: hypothetical protein LQ338_005601, partial [Usnochroma carphineum]
HIFCSPCSQTLGLDAAATPQRICPACETSLPNPDDVVSTQLNPTEDYKTSVLSGFSPSIIVECAGRGLAFWSYQSTQEIVYQEYLARSLTEKYNNLETEMDKIIHDANTEIDKLNQKISNLQIDRDKLQSENTGLVNAFREKSRKHQQTQELYDRLKRKEMLNATQSAAFESVDEVLGNHTARPSQIRPAQQSFSTRPQGQRDAPPYQYDLGQDLGHQRHGSNGSAGNGGVMMPPPSRRPQALGGHMLGHNFTPSHRTQLGPQMSNMPQQSGSRQNPGFPAGISHNPTPSRRMPLGTVSASSVNRSHSGGYGMSAGLKVGRQQVFAFGSPDGRGPDISEAGGETNQDQQLSERFNKTSEGKFLALVPLPLAVCPLPEALNNHGSAIQQLSRLLYTIQRDKDHGTWDNYLRLERKICRVYRQCGGLKHCLGHQHLATAISKMTVPMQRSSTYTSLELDFDVPPPTTSRLQMIRRASLRPWQLVSMVTTTSSPSPPERPRSDSGGNTKEN